MIKRLLGMFSRKPDFTIGRLEDVYMRRWYVIPRNRFFNIYLHNMLRDDDPVALHDHPWWNVSIVLSGGYWENMPAHAPHHVFTEALERSRGAYPDAYLANHYQESPGGKGHRRLWRKPGSIIFRRAVDAHRLELPPTGPFAGSDNRLSSWSLFITGPNKRVWGFWCASGWKPHTDFVRKNEQGNEVGAGCGES